MTSKSSTENEVKEVEIGRNGTFIFDKESFNLKFSELDGDFCLNGKCTFTKLTVEWFKVTDEAYEV